jgi:hypothetical protein
MNIKLFSTTPKKTDVFWQVVLFPTITVLRNSEFQGGYYAISVEWLFWSITTIINDN